MLAGYARGIFPMARTRDDPVLHWVNPRLRGVFDLDRFHLSRSLRRAILRGDYQIRADSNFAGTVAACAARSETWINAPLFRLYEALHARGAAHSLEVWDDRRLVGGVFGLTIGAAFFGESMFSHRTDGSKIALAYLVDRLRQGGFRLFDTQFLTPHLASLGAVEIPRAVYLARLAEAIAAEATFDIGPPPAPQLLVQRITQTS
jgi:leucyl/phenylalanyl-tRNA--protein transferase